MIINTSRISYIYLYTDSIPKKIHINLIQDDFSGLLIAGSGFLG